MLAWIMKALGFGGCRHEWEQFEIKGVLYRGCVFCPVVEKFEPDVSGWTAGHWDKFNKPTFNHNHWDL